MRCPEVTPKRADEDLMRRLYVGFLDTMAQCHNVHDLIEAGPFANIAHGNSSIISASGLNRPCREYASNTKRSNRVV